MGDGWGPPRRWPIQITFEAKKRLREKGDIMRKGLGICLTTVLWISLLCMPGIVYGQSGIFDRTGIMPGHGSHSSLPEESVDLFAGNVTLRYLDYRLPGPNGLEVGHRKLSLNANPKERRTFTTMAQQHYRIPFKKALLQFTTEPDPFLAMLKWVMTEMMRTETGAKVGASNR